MKSIFTTLFAWCFAVTTLTLPTRAQTSQLKLVFTGDIMGHDAQIASALATGEPGYDYEPCFEYLRPYLQGADLVIGNLEVTFAGTPYSGYPAFSSPDELADALKWAGFDILVNANNHALDRGRNGVIRTIEVLERKGIIQTGTFPDSAWRETYYPLILEKYGIRIALLNYTYGTNGIRDQPPVIVNRIDTTLMIEDLKKAKSAEPDFILVTLHWGNEYEATESEGQQELAGFLFRNGAHAIIGSHPHVIQPIRGDGAGNLVVFSMGNLISNQRDRYRDGGITFEMVLSKKREVPGGIVEKEISSYAYLPVWVWKPTTKKGTGFMLVPANLDPASEGFPVMSAEDRIKMTQFLDDTRSRLKGCGEVFNPPLVMDSTGHSLNPPGSDHNIHIQ
jgi:poly-gamma-glutamate synthesis protein (capsule biosynthesis protein)